jgi:hypothetical protein
VSTQPHGGSFRNDSSHHETAGQHAGIGQEPHDQSSAPVHEKVETTQHQPLRGRQAEQQDFQEKQINARPTSANDTQEHAAGSANTSSKGEDMQLPDSSATAAEQPATPVQTDTRRDNSATAQQIAQQPPAQLARDEPHHAGSYHIDISVKHVQMNVALSVEPTAAGAVHASPSAGQASAPASQGPLSSPHAGEPRGSMHRHHGNGGPEGSDKVQPSYASLPAPSAGSRPTSAARSRLQVCREYDICCSTLHAALCMTAPHYGLRLSHYQG